MRAPLYASPEFPNCNPDLHAGFIDPMLWPDVEDAFGDGEAEVVEELPELALSEAEIEVVGEAPESPRESMIRLVAAVSAGGGHGGGLEDEDDLDFTSLSIPTLPPMDTTWMDSIVESDLDAATSTSTSTSTSASASNEAPVAHEGGIVFRMPEAPQASDEIEAACSSDAFVRLFEGIVAVSEVDVSVDALVELFSGRPVPSALLAATKLEVSGLVTRDEREGFVLAASVAKPAREWALIVRDEGGDFDACGGKTLDEFAAEIAAGLVGDRSRTDTLRRSLRSRGIAAYGLVDAA